MRRVYNHKGKLQMEDKLHMTGKLHAAKPCWSIEAYKQEAIDSCND